jgi:hypothetical protein
MKERRNTREEMTTDGIYAKIKDGSCHSDDLLTRKPILRTVVSQEDDTEESSDDDDISYGSDGSSIDGDFNDDFRCSLTDEDSMFSDEEVFSEEEDEYDLGTREVRTYELYDCFKPCRDFDEPLYTISEENEELDTVRMIEDEELFTIIEEADVPLLQTDPASHEEQEFEVYQESYTPYTHYHSSYTSSIQDSSPLMLVEAELMLFTISEEPELEEKYETEENESSIEPEPEQWIRTPTNPGLTEVQDCKLDLEETLPDLETLISNLEASLADSDFMDDVEKEYSTATSRNSQSRSRSKPELTECRQDAQEYDHVYASFGISLLNLEKSFSLR